MATDLTHKLPAETVDLTGLPEPVVQDIRKLVQTLREKLSGEGRVSPVEGRTPLRNGLTDPNSPGPREDNGTAQQEPYGSLPKFISRPRLAADELERVLDEFSAGPPGKVLPPDFSRADIYDDHD
jgi:hypothetical protein